MTKRELAALIATDTGLTQQVAAAALDSALHGIMAALMQGESVTFNGFGVFEVEAYRASGGAWTGIRPAFRPAAAFKDVVGWRGAP